MPTVVSMFLNPSKWAGAILVINPWVGFVILQSFWISPGWFAPISMIEAPWYFVICNSVSGKLIEVLKFSSVAWISNLADRICLSSSFVEVLPFEPVIPITGMLNLSLHIVAISLINPIGFEFRNCLSMYEFY